MDSDNTVVDSCSNDCLQELKKLKNHTYKKGINANILIKFLMAILSINIDFIYMNPSLNVRKKYMKILLIYLVIL